MNQTILKTLGLLHSHQLLASYIIKYIFNIILESHRIKEIKSHASVNKRTCHITCFDLEDTFGTISHNLINLCLERYNIPENIRKYIKELYSNISGQVARNGWLSEGFFKVTPSHLQYL